MLTSVSKRTLQATPSWNFCCARSTQTGNLPALPSQTQQGKRLKLCIPHCEATYSFVYILAKSPTACSRASHCATSTVCLAFMAWTITAWCACVGADANTVSVLIRSTRINEMPSGSIRQKSNAASSGRDLQSVHEIFLLGERRARSAHRLDTLAEAVFCSNMSDAQFTATGAGAEQKARAHR